MAVRRQKNTHVNYHEFIKHLMIFCDIDFNTQIKVCV